MRFLPYYNTDFECVAYDSTKLELVSVVDNTGKANMVNGTKLAYLDMTGNSITLSQGKVATATFKIAEGATGDAVVSAEMYYSDLDDNYLPTSANSKVTIKVAANSISLDKSTLSLVINSLNPFCIVIPI